MRRRVRLRKRPRSCQEIQRAMVYSVAGLQIMCHWHLIDGLIGHRSGGHTLKNKHRNEHRSTFMIEAV